MITTFYDLDKELRHLGYTKMKEEAKYRKTYYKVERKDSDYVCKIVVCLDLLGEKILTSEGVDIVKGIASVQFEGTSPDNVLVIALDRKGTTNISGENIIFYDRDVLKIKGRTTELFEDELNGLKENLKSRKREELHAKALWENGKKKYSAAVIYALMAFIAWMQFSYTGGNGDVYGISAYEVYKNGQSYRLVSYLFTHASIGHLISNCTSLFIIGRMYARKRSTLDVLIIFLGGGILAGISSITAKMFVNEPTVLTVGASGAVFAVLGALLMNVFMDNATIGFRKEYVKYAVVTLVLSSISGNVDNVCHITGFLCGGLLEFILSKADNIYAYTKYVETRDKARTSF